MKKERVQDVIEILEVMSKEAIFTSEERLNQIKEEIENIKQGKGKSGWGDLTFLKEAESFWEGKRLSWLGALGLVEAAEEADTKKWKEIKTKGLRGFFPESKLSILYYKEKE